MNKKKNLCLVLLLIFCVIRAEDNHISLTQDPEREAQHHEKAIDPLEDIDDEFEEFDRIMCTIDTESFSRIEPLPWWKQTLVNLGATIYLRYRFCRKWFSGFLEGSDSIKKA